MAIKQETAGALLLLLLVLNRNDSGSSAGRTVSGSPGRAGSRLPIGWPDLGSLAREFHRMVGVMEKVDSLGQMAVNPPRLPEPSQLINTNALPDMSALIDMMGPLLGNLNGEKK
ncbi:MAG: hypothetical protein IKM19_05615 [Firmicutes bacterium]|nr:hypothetical protein [Bacillota bacterium]MBR3706425.1 hypothetical protein [Bacillota bacterium]MBR6585734.1 hypothetical protein [Bacillota bacterium]